MVCAPNAVLRCLHAAEHELGLPLRPGHAPDAEDGSLSAASEMSSDELAEAHTA